MQVAPYLSIPNLPYSQVDFFSDSDFAEFDQIEDNNINFMDLDLNHIPEEEDENSRIKDNGGSHPDNQDDSNSNRNGNEKTNNQGTNFPWSVPAPAPTPLEPTFSADAGSSSPSALLEGPRKPVWSFFNSTRWIPFDESTSEKIEAMYDSCDTAYDWVTDSNFRERIYVQLPDTMVYKHEVQYKIKRTLLLGKKNEH